MKTPCPFHTGDVHEWTGTDDFVAELKRRSRLLDVFLIASVPVVLIGVHTLPSNARSALAFDYADPSIVTAYTANFVHLNKAHLLGNLGAYAVVVPTAYVLSVLSYRRRHFRWNFAVVLVLCPFLISGTATLFGTEGIALGFSGVAMALYGYASLVFVGYLATRLTTGLHLDHAPLVFFVQTTAISLVASPVTLTSLVVTGISGSLAVLYLLWLSWSLITSSEPLLSPEVRRAGYVEVGLIVLITGSFLVLEGFSGGRIGDGVVNVFSHLVGFASGFILAYVVLRTDCSIAHINHCAGPDTDCELHDSFLTRTLRRLILAIRL